MNDAELTVATIRLLLHAAWADNSIAPEEYDFLYAMASRAGFSKEDIMSLDNGLRNRHLLHPPDLELLKSDRDNVLRQVQALIEADNLITTEEADFLHTIAAALS